MRVRDLAIEFGTSSTAILRLLQGRGFYVRNASSRIDVYAVEWLRSEFTVFDTPAEQSAPPELTDTQSRRHVPEAPVAQTPAPPSWIGSAARRRFVRPYRMLSLPELATPPDRRVQNRRPLSAVPTFGATKGEVESLSLEAIDAGLVGSPYSLPPSQADYLLHTFLPRVAALSIRAKREAARVQRDRLATLQRITRSTEIYESNKLEGLGPDMATTDSLLNTYNLHQRTDISVAQNAIHRCLTSEPKVRDVIGLGAARLLAEIFCADRERPLAESDIRQLHYLVMVGDPQRGVYKRYINSIEGSEHTPTAPSDTPAAMNELARWLADTSLAPLWRAAVAHAWLTHIHPFHDGNGRIARLLANLVLIREGLPPLIISASGDRGRYIDALAASDGGGDILPLARVFRRVLSRAVHDMTNPLLLDQLFEAELEQRSAPWHVRWNRILAEFLSELAAHLLLHRLSYFELGDVREPDLMRWADGYPDNVWVAKVGVPGASRDLLLNAALPTQANRRLLPERALTPSVFVSVRNERTLDAGQYLPVGGSGYDFEFTPLVATNQIYVRHRRNGRALPVSQASAVVADHLERAHRQLIGRSQR